MDYVKPALVSDIPEYTKKFKNSQIFSRLYQRKYK